MSHFSSQRRSSRWLPPAGRRPKWRRTSAIDVERRGTTSRSSASVYRGTNICSHAVRTELERQPLGSQDSNPDSRDQRPSVLPVTPLPNDRDRLAPRRYYDASGVCAHRRHHRRRRRNPHALRAAQGPAPALRPPADPVARHGRARGRGREGRRGRQPEAAARGPAARGRRGRDPGAAQRHGRRGPAAANAHRRRRDRRRDQRRRPADHRRGARAARRRARATAAPPAPWRRWSSTTRRATGASSATSDGNVERVVETKAEGDATPEQLAIREVNTGVYAFDGASRSTALDADRHRQRPGRALPARRAAEADRGRQDGPRRTWSATRRSRSASTTASSSPRSASSPSSASTTRHARNGVTIIDPDEHDHRRRRDDRPGHDRRAEHVPPRARRRSARTARSGR